MPLVKRGKIWHVRTQVAGMTIAKSTKTTVRRVAEQLEAKWVAEVHSEVVVAGRKPLTTEKAIAAFLESRRGTAGYESADVKTRMFKPFHSQQIHEVNPLEVEQEARRLVEDENYSINTINVSLIYWNAMQNFLSKAGYTPGKKVRKLKGGSNRVRFLTDQEVTKLLEALNPSNGAYREKRKAQDNYDFTVFLLHTGAREQEIATLKLNQIDTERNTITIHRSKGGTDTTMSMSKELVQILARRQVAGEQPLVEGQQLHGRADAVHLFPERAKGRYNNEYLAKACSRIGLKDVSLHTLRHTFACKVLRSGKDLVTLQRLLGHRNLSSTQCYAHLQLDLTGESVATLWES